MRIEGQHAFSAPVDVVWQAVLDPQVLAKIMPGCEGFEATGENQFKGKLKVKVGPVQGEFLGDVILSNIRPNEGYHLQLRGKGAPGFVEGEGDLNLSFVDGQCILAYSIDNKIGGRIATVGQRLLESSTKVITRQALEGLEAQVNARAEIARAEAARADLAVHAAAGEAQAEDEKARRWVEEARAAAEALAPKSQSELAAEVAKGVAADLAPTIVKWILVVVALGGLLWLLLR
jgi:uncharacterized protein